MKWLTHAISIGILAAILVPLARGIDTPARKKTDFVPVQVSKNITVLNARVGMFKENADGEQEFTKVKEITWDEGTGYGWVLDVSTPQRTVEVEEKIKLPSAPTTWGDLSDGKTQIVEDGTAAITKLSYPVVDGQVMNSWTFTEGDPDGEYSISLKIAGVPVVEKKIKVVKKAAEAQP
jgi:hypothetical protein